MNYNAISPFIRVAMKSYLKAPFCIKRRIIFDYELIFLERGKWKITVDEQEHICCSPCVILLCPNHPHKIESSEGISVSQPHIHFDLTYDDYSEKRYVSFKDFEDLPENERILICPDVLTYFISETPILKITDLEHFKTLFFDVISAYQSGESMYQLLCKQKMIKLLYFLFMQREPLPLYKDNIVQSRIHLIKNYIDSNYTNTISLDCLSMQFHIDKFYMSKKYKQAYGTSIIKYYNSVRLTGAKEQLLRTGNVSQAAFSLGFQSSYQFSRFFKNYSGVSPTEYINKFK